MQLSLLLALLLTEPSLGQVTATNAKATDDEQYRAPLYGLTASGRVPNQYIVMFNWDGGGYDVARHWEAVGIDLSSSNGFTHLSTLSGYLAEMNTTTLDTIRRDPNVAFVETSRRIQAISHGFQTISHGELTAGSLSSRFQPTIAVSERPFEVKTDQCADWNFAVMGAGEGLDIPVENGEHDYQYLEGPGRGVKIYNIDAGILLSHEGFGGRASNFPDLPSDEDSPFIRPPEPLSLIGHHGTGVAGAAVGSTVGVAKAAQVLSVKVKSPQTGHCYNDLLVKALDAIIDQHKKDRLLPPPWDFRGSIMLLSLGLRQLAPHEEALRRALKSAKENGVPMISAAGNRCWDLEEHAQWPCGIEDAICVGAIDDKYELWLEEGNVGSNFGPGVDYLAPGYEVQTFGIANDNDEITVSGTSMAVGEVAGIAAIFASWQSLKDGDIRQYLEANSLEGECTNLPDNQRNVLANTGILLKGKPPSQPFKFPPETAPEGEGQSSDNPSAKAMQVDGDEHKQGEQ